MVNLRELLKKEFGCGVKQQGKKEAYLPRLANLR